MKNKRFIPKLKRRCKCGCGEITSPGCKWVYGHQARNKNNSNYKHGLKNHKLYSVWHNMKTRCYNPKTTYYQDYGDRDIKVYIRWRLSFKSFYNWAIAHGWEEGLQIDREDNDGNYHPNNCRFVTCQVNNSNKRQYKNNSSGHKGVTFHKASNKYQARCCINRKQKYLGVFNTSKEASKAIKDYMGESI